MTTMDPSLLSAAITAVPATIAASAAYLQARKSAAIAQGNGKGPVDKMLEQVIDKLERQDGQLADLKDWTVKHRLDHLDG